MEDVWTKQRLSPSEENRKQREGILFSPFFFIQPGYSVYMVGPSTFRVNLLSSVKPQKSPQKHTEMYFLSDTKSSQLDNEHCPPSSGPDVDTLEF